MLTLSNSNLDGGLSSYTEGICKNGGDFVCGTRGDIHSCRPCQLAGLDNFRSLQGEINRIVQFKSLAGLLDIDGRMGPRTARALAAAAAATSNVITAPAAVSSVIAACAAHPDSADTHRQIAVYVPELRAYFAQIANQLGAGANYPEAPMPDADKAGNAPIPITEPDGGIVYEPPGAQAGFGSWGPLLALAGVLAGGGLAFVGYKRYQSRSARRARRY